MLRSNEDMTHMALVHECMTRHMDIRGRDNEDV